MSSSKINTPLFSPSDAEEIVLSFFNLTGKASKLVGFEDLNFKFLDQSGKTYILKIARSEPVGDELDMQNAIMQHLAVKDLPFILPEVVPNIKGELMTEITDGNGRARLMRLLTWVPGRIWAYVNPRRSGLLKKLGKSVGLLNAALSDFHHPMTKRNDGWDLAQSIWVKEIFHFIKEDNHRQIADYFFQLFEEALPKLKSLRKQVCHNDANDYNVLVDENLEDPSINGFIDFGDSIFTQTINELAICIAYVINEQPDPLSAAVHLVSGFNEIVPLKAEELEILYGLVGTRILVSVASAAKNKVLQPNNEYLQINAKPGWETLEKWITINPRYAYYCFRQACGMVPCPKEEVFNNWLQENAIRIEDLFGSEFAQKSIGQLDFSVGSTAFGNNSNFDSYPAFARTVRNMLEELEIEIGIGGYGETRPFYTTDAYQVIGNNGPRWRTVHLGTDVWAKAGTAIFTPWDGTVHSFQNNPAERDYGPTIILQHQMDDGQMFYSLYGHLDKASIENLNVGQTIKKGNLLSRIGPAPENGNWPPHLHFQIILDLIGNKGDFPGVAFPDEKEIWLSICPNGINGTKGGRQIPGYSNKELTALRKKILSQNLSLSFKKPLHIVRGYMQYLYDADGRRYLDTNNNVPHVGHQNPNVVKAAQRQIAVLNTNTRYLHDTIVRYAEELLATFPSELSVCHFVNSGSEANELALRMAKIYSRQQDMIAVEHGYHGNTGGCIDISSYKFDGKGGAGVPPFTHIVPIPDTYRGLYRYGISNLGQQYADHVSAVIEKVKGEGRNIAGFICESILSCGGQVVLPEGYLQAAYAAVRAAGGVCIADEVQVGFGRSGDAFWAFELQGVIPDIITLGKPIGNGHPLAAVVTTKAVADAFNNGMEYFNTFGGNPVSCAIGRAVLKEIKTNNLQENARNTGNFMKTHLERLKADHQIIGDVRGYGLFLGFELVKSRDTLEPATEAASYLKNRMKDLGVLISTDGPYENVIKIKPPLCFNIDNAHFFIETLGTVLREDFLNH
ncbi:MAG: aminotransferase class III-fold pyridoxal phosphate-dependent enzyme [Bacteroidota bacterium]